jgi:hypothetical protein
MWQGAKVCDKITYIKRIPAHIRIILKNAVVTYTEITRSSSMIVGVDEKKVFGSNLIHNGVQGGLEPWPSTWLVNNHSVWCVGTWPVAQIRTDCLLC